MKVGCFLSSFPSVTETFILNQLTGLLDRNVNLSIFSLYPEKEGGVRHEDIDRYRLMERVTYWGSRDIGLPENRPVRLLKALSLLCTAYRPELLKSLNLRRFGPEARSLALFFRTHFFSGIDSEKFDIIHGHFGPNGALLAQLKEVGILPAALVTTFYGSDVLNYVRRNGPNCYARLFKAADRILCLSDKMKGDLIGFGCPPEKVSVHHLGIDPDAFSPRSGGKAGDAFKIAIVARLVEKKGVEFAVRAIAGVLRSEPGIKLECRVVGDGPLRERIESLARELGIDDCVKIVGWRKQAEIVEILRESDVLLAPSVTSSNGDQEGTPTVILEAMALEIPVLSTLHSGIPEMVEEGRTGFLVPEKDVDALAKNLEILIKNRELRQRMGRSGRDRVLRDFNIHRQNERLVQLYRELAGRKSGLGPSGTGLPPRVTIGTGSGDYASN